MNTKEQRADEIRPYKYPRFGKYVLHKIQGHSTQHHFLFFTLIESKLADFFISRGSKFHT